VIGQGALAGFAGATGTEWSLFCPGMGMAMDSCVADMLLFARAPDDAVREGEAGVRTEAASGTEDGTAGAASLLTVGVGVAGGV
jgi:hypothetical protein